MNWLAIVVAAISWFIIGGIWYSVLFKQYWIAATGMTEEKQKQGSALVIFGVSFLFAFLASFFMSEFVWHEDSPEFHTFQHGAFHGAILGVFVILPALGTNALYEQKSWQYILINAGYWIVSFAVMGGILNIWR